MDRGTRLRSPSTQPKQPTIGSATEPLGEGHLFAWGAVTELRKATLIVTGIPKLTMRTTKSSIALESNARRAIGSTELHTEPGVILSSREFLSGSGGTICRLSGNEASPAVAKNGVEAFDPANRQ